MFRLVHETEAKARAQEELLRTISDALPSLGRRRIGFQGGTVNREIFSGGYCQLWASINIEPTDDRIPRYWNAFGILDDKPTQSIAVEVNIPTYENTWQVAGAFVVDDAGSLHLMHDGKVGGGRKGIGKHEFMRLSRLGVVDVLCDDGRLRKLIPIGEVSDAGLVARLFDFVSTVSEFKTVATDS